MCSSLSREEHRAQVLAHRGGKRRWEGWQEPPQHGMSDAQVSFQLMREMEVPAKRMSTAQNKTLYGSSSPAGLKGLGNGDGGSKLNLN